MSVANLTKFNPTYWVPPTSTTNWRLTVERSDGTIDDVTDILKSLTIEDTCTSGIGGFEFEIYNPNQTYNGVWNGMEIVRYYADYESGTTTTLRFRGRIEKPSTHGDYMLKVTGRSESLFVQEKNVNKTFDGIDAGVAIKDLFDTYGESRFDTSSIETSTGVTITMTFIDYTFWGALEDICNASGYDCYIDHDLVVQFFEVGSVDNTIDAIVHDYNLLNQDEFAKETQRVKNRIRVKGGLIDGVRVVYTANDTASQSSGIREKTITDDSITTFDAAKELADSTLAFEKDVPVVGEVECVLLAGIQPGENIRVSNPGQNIPPAFYNSVSYKHVIENGFGRTFVRINKEPRKLNLFLKNEVQKGNRKSDSSDNLHDLDFSDIELFNADSGTYSNTIITEGVLKLIPGYSTGTWTSDTKDSATGNDITKLSVDFTGTDIPNISTEYSVNNGLSFTSIPRGSLVTLTGTGKKIKVRFTLNGATAEIKSVKIQYTTS